MSKIGVNRLTELQAKALASDPTRPGILVNTVSHLCVAFPRACYIPLPSIHMNTKKINVREEKRGEPVKYKHVLSLMTRCWV